MTPRRATRVFFWMLAGLSLCHGVSDADDAPESRPSPAASPATSRKASSGRPAAPPRAATRRPDSADEAVPAGGRVVPDASDVEAGETVPSPDADAPVRPEAN